MKSGPAASPGKGTTIMLHLPCSHCGKEVEVESLLEAARQDCPSCGHLLMGGEPARPDPAPAKKGGVMAGINWLLSDEPGGFWEWLTGARVTISRAEARRLPRVCMVCGTRAEQAIEQRFTNPRASATSRMMGTADYSSWPLNQSDPYVNVAVPLCFRHRSYFQWQILFDLMFAVMLLVLGGLFFYPPFKKLADLPEWPLIVGSVTGLAVVIGFSWLSQRSRSIRATAIRDDSIDLKGVSPRFIAALQEFREKKLYPEPAEE